MNMQNWAFFNAKNGNEITRGLQCFDRASAREHAQQYADDRGVPVEFIRESDLPGPDGDENGDWQPPDGEIVEPSESLPHVAWLKACGACERGIAFARRYATLADAWEDCEADGDMDWVYVTIKEIEAGYDPNADIDEQFDFRASHAITSDDPDVIRAEVALPDYVPPAPEYGIPELYTRKAKS